MKFHLIRVIKFLILIFLSIILWQLIRQLLRKSNTRFILPTEQSQQRLDVEFHEISYSLEPFRTYLPHFPDDEARDWFLNSTYYRMYSKQCPNNLCETNGFLFDDPQEHLQVHLALVKNGLYLDDDCGFRYSAEAIRRTFKSTSETSETSVIYDKAIIYTVSDGWSFQHFLDGIGPKLSHSRMYLDKYPDAKVVIQKGIRFDPSVREIWRLLGVSKFNRIIHNEWGIKLGARLLINPCRTPATHPVLWHDARRMYWSLANLSESSSTPARDKFIYLQRTKKNSKNLGRYILNEEPFIEILQQHATKSSLNFIQYDHSQQRGTVINQIQLFYQARVIIGVHGGAQSNMNFAQPGTTIIEIMPYRAELSTVPNVCSSKEVKPCVGYIYYTQSQLLNLSYWILPTKVDDDGNLHVNLIRIQRILDSLT